ncbi:MAG: hypothetical protein GY853_13115 [PVC group bacterium]|nr:hypothetical protein [PVC group bacterium]
MPRLPRVHIEGSAYYVTCKGLQNQVIFKDKRDYEMYFGLLKKYKEQYNVKLYAYTLMHNHLHLLMEVDDKTSISTLMHDLSSSYTKYFNGRYQRKGHLFRERFKAALIEKDPLLLLNLSAYIHLNPKRLNLAIQARTYPHSSYALYLDYLQQNDRGLNIKSEVDGIVNQLLGENYADFVSRMADNEEFLKTHKKLRKGMVGSKEFIKKVKSEIEKQRAQAQVEETPTPVNSENDADGKKKLLIGVGTALMLVTLSVSGVYVYFNYMRNETKQTSEPVVQAPGVVQEEEKRLNDTVWQITLMTLDGKLFRNDHISFIKGKFISAYFSRLDFPQINYSVVVDGDKIIWETMQRSSQGKLSWRGEVKNGQMNGIINLRENGKQPQDFSFKSFKYRRR